MTQTDLDTLQQTLATELFRDGEQAWLLFDALHLDVADCIDDIAAEDIYNIPLDREDIPPAREAKLVSITSRQVERIRQSLAFALEEQSDAAQEERQGFAIGGWLASNAPVKQLTMHLSRCMSQRIPAEGRRYFRWADRRVMEWMWPALDETEKASLLGPVSQWWTLDRVSQLASRLRLALSDVTAFSGRWELSSANVYRAGNCALAQVLLRDWQEEIEHLPLDYLNQVTNAITQTQSLQLEIEEDVGFMASLILQVHPRLPHHPAIEQAVSQSKSHQKALASILARVPSAGWQQIQKELNGQKRPFSPVQGAQL